MISRLGELPRWSHESVLEQLQMVDAVETQIGDCEKQLAVMLYPSAERDLLKTIPCVGKILSAVIALEIGDVRRFPSAAHLVSYAGLVPSARESAERKRQGGCPRDCNVYLKWAFVEAGNLIACKQKHWPDSHALRLYRRVKQSTKMHGKATMAVARHLAEASYWILSKQEVYREPKVTRQFLSSTTGKRELTHGSWRLSSECETRQRNPGSCRSRRRMYGSDERAEERLGSAKET